MPIPTLKCATKGLKWQRYFLISEHWLLLLQVITLNNKNIPYSVTHPIQQMKWISPEYPMNPIAMCLGIVGDGGHGHDNDLRSCSLIISSTIKILQTFFIHRSTQMTIWYELLDFGDEETKIDWFIWWMDRNGCPNGTI